MTKDELQEIEARCEAANQYLAVLAGKLCCSRSAIDDLEKNNVDFIAHARTDIPTLLAYVKELEAQIKTMGQHIIKMNEFLSDEF